MGNGGKTGDEERRYRNDVKDFLKRRGQDMPIFIRVMEGAKEDYISTTAENIANYIGSHMFEAEKDRHHRYV